MTTTPQLSSIFKGTRDAVRSSMQIIMPATVESYDSATQRASVKPAICPVRSDGSFLSIPVIPDVPVVFPGGGGWEFTFPIITGDTVLVVVSSSSIDEWKLDGNPLSKPRSRRTHDISDAFALPDIRPKSRPRLHATQGVTLSNLAGTTSLSLSDAIAVLTSAVVKLGSASAVDPVASTLLADVNFEFIKNWGVIIETAINGLAPGTFTPANTIFNQFPTVAMAKVFGE